MYLFRIIYIRGVLLCVYPFWTLLFGSIYVSTHLSDDLRLMTSRW